MNNSDTHGNWTGNDMDISTSPVLITRAAYLYGKPPCNNICCKETFAEHLSWKKHYNVKHRQLELVYICSKCHKEFTSINSVSSHFPYCTGNSTLPPTIYEFACAWCDFSCPTKTGLGVHSRSAHPTQFEESKIVKRVKAHWTEEEIRMLACAEIELTPGTRFINQALLKRFPERSLEAIKGMRNKNDRYKRILASIKEHRVTSAPRILPATPRQNLRSSRTRLICAASPRLLPASPAECIQTIPTPSESSLLNLLASSPETEVDTDPFIVAIKKTYTCDNKLKNLIDERISGVDNSTEFSLYFSKEHQKSYKSNKRSGDSNTCRYKRKIRLRRYARYQQMYRRNKRNLADMIINDKEEASIFPSAESIKETYKSLYESNSPEDDEPFVPKSDTIGVHYPITSSELNNHMKTLKASAPGTDNVDLAYLKSLSDDYLLTVLNYQLWCRTQITCLKINRTNLIPKKNEGLHDASNWRPITLSSMFVRLLHGIIAKRIMNAIHLSPRQKAFIPADGCAQNTLLLDALISDARSSHRQLSIVGIDLTKAFDMVSINSIRRALMRFAVDAPLIEYIIDAYSNATTTIQCGPTKVEHVRLARGVKQGDPLSPILFNMVIDELLEKLPLEIGAKLDDHSINSMAFADDIILISESKVGMKKLIKITEDFFDARSFKVNARKCFSLRLSTTKKDRAPYVFKEPTYTIDKSLIDATGYDTFFKYLGINFNPHGKMKPSIKTLETLIERIRKTPLKPFQKLELLRKNIIPKILHQLVLGRVTKGLLDNFDSAEATF